MAIVIQCDRCFRTEQFGMKIYFRSWGDMAERNFERHMCLRCLNEFSKWLDEGNKHASEV